MSQIPVNAMWDGLSPLDAKEITSRVPPTINIETDPQDQTRMLIDDKDLPLLSKAVKSFGLTVRPISL